MRCMFWQPDEKAIQRQGEEAQLNKYVCVHILSIQHPNEVLYIKLFARHSFLTSEAS